MILGNPGKRLQGLADYILQKLQSSPHSYRPLIPTRFVADIDRDGTVEGVVVEEGPRPGFTLPHRYDTFLTPYGASAP